VISAGADRVADGVWTVAHGDRRCVFAEADGSAIAFNTLGGGEATDALRDAIASTLPGKSEVSHIVYTLDHLDQTAGAARLAAEASVIAHELCARVVAERAHPEQSVVTREVTGDRETVELDGRRIELSYPGPTQGTGNLAVVLDGVLFVVGPRADARYGLWPDVHFRHAARIWRELADRDLQAVVPGRGPVMDADGLRVAANYLDALAEAAQRAFADGVPIWIYEAMEPYVRERLRAMYGTLDGFDDHVGIAAIRIVHYYLMGGWGLEDSARPELVS
jgi:glyoxylase-like metal-dependent hydrolase (beta-lactamase superfamily II)